jgi:hypothetical protein
MTATTTRSRTARKVIGSLGVIGAAAAVAGMGTFGSFTDSTTPLDASIGTGTLALDLTAPTGGAVVSMNATGFVPGDSISRAVELVNGGPLGFASIKMATTATASSILDTDKTNGLQLAVSSCPVKWTEAVVNGVTTYSCTSPTSLAGGSAVGTTNFINGSLASLNGNSTDHLLLSLSLPTSAGDTFQGKTSALSIVFTGSQKTGTNR